MTPLEKLASNRALRVHHIPDDEIEALFAEPMRKAGYIAPARVVLNEQSWWSCYVWDVVEFLKHNSQ